jgi:hypothetical protein
MQVFITPILQLSHPSNCNFTTHIASMCLYKQSGREHWKLISLSFHMQKVKNCYNIVSAVINGAGSELENRKIVFINLICLSFLGVKLFHFEGRKKITSNLKKRVNL